MPGSDASQFTRFKKANATQRGDTQQSDSKSVNRLTQYVPRLSGASGVGKFLSSLTKSSSSGSSGGDIFIVITAADVSNQSISFTIQAGKYYVRNDSGQDVCIGSPMGRSDTLINGQTLFIGEVPPNFPRIGATDTEQLRAGACSGVVVIP